MRFLRTSRRSKAFALVAASTSGLFHSSRRERNEVITPARVFSEAMEMYELSARTHAPDRLLPSSAEALSKGTTASSAGMSAVFGFFSRSASIMRATAARYGADRWD